MSLTILYLHSCHRERLRAAFDHNIQIHGPVQTARIVNAIAAGYAPNLSPRVNYNHALLTLQDVAGLAGLAAISIIKEAWNPDSLTPLCEQEPVADIAHPSTNTTQ